MKEKELVHSIHYYFMAVLRLRQNLKQRVQRKLIDLGYEDITLEMTQVLYYLHFDAEGEANQQEIADNIGKNKSSLTSLIDNLSKREMIKRNINPKNRRNNIITLTKKGKKFMEEFLPVVYKTYNTSKLSMTLKDINNLTQTLNSFIEI
ncbi:MAG: MarR family transcriptional regulator [Arachidicoccus sp.]|nr:MarR family transcriptional regulator [Arachidicoccus sp.]